MTETPSAKPIDTVKQLLEDLESIIADYPQHLRRDYADCKRDCKWWDEGLDDEKSEVKGISEGDLASIHRLLFVSAFIASASSLPDQKISDNPIESTAILDAATEAGLPTRDFLRHYGAYGNLFTWKLLKLTGRIRESSDQPAPSLV